MLIQSIRAMVRKDLRITFRNPSLMILSVIVPVVFIFMYSLITQLSATNPVVIAQEGQGPVSNRLVHILTEMRSVDGPYFEIITLDPDEAFRLYNNGQAAALIRIPGSLDQQAAAGEKPKITLYVYNINSDATKNYQLRVAHALYTLQKEKAPTSIIRVDEQFSKFHPDIAMKTYVAMGLLMFATIYSALVNTGTLIAREWEERTGKEISLTPAGFTPFILGKGVTAFIQTVVSLLLVMGVMYLTIDFPLSQVNLELAGWLFVLFLLGASIGTFAGTALRKSLPVITLSAVLGISLYLVSGNESSIRGFAHGGPIEVLWKISTYIPVSAVTDQMRFIFLQNEMPIPYTDLVVSLGLTALFAGAAVVKMKRSLFFSGGQ